LSERKTPEERTDRIKSDIRKAADEKGFKNYDIEFREGENPVDHPSVFANSAEGVIVFKDTDGRIISTQKFRYSHSDASTKFAMGSKPHDSTQSSDRK
jgi:hypothetical protein